MNENKIVQPTVIDTVRMYCQVRGWSLEKAVAETIKRFDERGWDVPASFRSVKAYQDERDGITR